MSMSEFAHTLGYAGSSSIQPYEISGDYDRDYLPEKLVRRMRDSLIGKGKPPITLDEIAALGSASLFAHAEPVGDGVLSEQTVRRAVRLLSQNGLIGSGNKPDQTADEFIDFCRWVENQTASGNNERAQDNAAAVVSFIKSRLGVSDENTRQPVARVPRSPQNT